MEAVRNLPLPDTLGCTCSGGGGGHGDDGSGHRRRAVAGVRPSTALQCTTEPGCTTKRTI